MFSESREFSMLLDHEVRFFFKGDFQLSLSHRNSRILLHSNGQVRHLLYLVDPRNVHATS